MSQPSGEMLSNLVKNCEQETATLLQQLKSSDDDFADALDELYEFQEKFSIWTADTCVQSVSQLYVLSDILRHLGGIPGGCEKTSQVITLI